jgi:23S rRNA pseudouridine2457 synthase
VARILLFNKPYDVLSQFTDKEGRATLGDFITDPMLRVAGRLDRDSEGLIVLTDSGALAHKITHPDKTMSKTYWVQVEGIPAERDLDPLIEGLELSDGPCRPAKSRPIPPPPSLWPRNPPIRVRKTVPDSWLELTISEGRNRQVRRMCAAIGFPALRLIRYRVGSWTIDGLDPGKTRIV